MASLNVWEGKPSSSIKLCVFYIRVLSLNLSMFLGCENFSSSSVESKCISILSMQCVPCVTLNYIECNYVAASEHAGTEK